MKLAFIIVAIVLFILDFLAGWIPNWPMRSLTPLGLAFLSASFLPL